MAGQKRDYTNTDANNIMTRPKAKKNVQAMAHRLAQAVTRNAAARYAATKSRRPKGPRGMAGSAQLYVTDANGYVTDPVSLDRIPKSRAVRVGPHTFNSKTLTQMFQHNPRATNPLTRQPFPQAVYAKYAPAEQPPTTFPVVMPRDLSPEQRRVWEAGGALMTMFRRARAGGYSLQRYANEIAAEQLHARYGVRLIPQYLNIVNIEIPGNTAIKGKVQYSPRFDELSFSIRYNGQHLISSYEP